MKFQVTVRRAEYRSHVFTVDASSPDEAEEVAMDEAGDHDFSQNSVNHADKEVVMVCPEGPWPASEVPSEDPAPAPESPRYVPFEELPLEEIEKHDGIGVTCPNGSTVEVWKIRNRDAFHITLRRLLEDGRQTELKFGISHEASAALCGLLQGHLYPDLMKELEKGSTPPGIMRDPETDPPTKTGKILVLAKGGGPAIVNVEERWMCFWDGENETEATCPDEWTAWMEIPSRQIPAKPPKERACPDDTPLEPKDQAAGGDCQQDSCSVVCPQCNGWQRMLTFMGVDLGECPMCEGSGRASDEKRRWYSYGQQLKALRIAKRLRLRQAARLIGMDPSNLSKMERGLIRPHPIQYP